MRRTPPCLTALAILLGAPAARAHAQPLSEEARVAAVLQSTLVAHGAEVNRCFEKALADTLDVAGKVELAVDVGEGGRVTNAEPASDDVKSPVLLACLQEMAQTWTIAGLDAGSKVIVPLTFEGQMAQWTVKVADAPARGPAAARHPSPAGAPFSVKVLIDEATMRARQASMSLLTVSPASRIAMHKHPGAEILYVVSGHARVLGPSGTAPEKLNDGMALFIPPGMPHVIENMGRTSSAAMLQIFAPPGPERVYRDPNDVKGRAAFEVIRSGGRAPAGAHFTVASTGKPVALGGGGAGKGHARVFLDPAATGSNAASLTVIEAEPGAELPRQTIESASLLFVRDGAGHVTVGSDRFAFGADQAIHVPENQPHAVKFGDRSLVVAVFAPAGPEQRWKKAAR
ncbi:MAG TPA: cupin domain-containing protein [Polyangia bacterium]|nr:cupin domain-containing protein [Polyangia bacterium]